METTKSGVPIHTGSGSPEAYLSALIYAHALGLSLRSRYVEIDEDKLAERIRGLLIEAADDIVWPGAGTSGGAQGNTPQSPSDARIDELLGKIVESASRAAESAVAIAALTMSQSMAAMQAELTKVVETYTIKAPPAQDAGEAFGLGRK